VQVGVPADTAAVVDLPLSELFGHGGSLRSSWYGDSLPTRDFPILVDLYKRGRLDLDAFVTETIGVNEVEEAFAKIERSEVLRSVVVF
jgi:S-(hydroxymethyl)mycothiol dehydrogenase